MKKIINSLSLSVMLATSAFVSFGAAAQEEGCYVFRQAQQDATSEISISSSCTGSVTSQGSTPEDSTPEGEGAGGGSSEMTPEDEASWVQFINDNCFNYEGQTYATLQEIQDHPFSWYCDGSATSLPPSGPTYFTEGLIFDPMSLASLDGLSSITSLPYLYLKETSITSLDGLEGLTTMMELVISGGDSFVTPLTDVSGLSSLQSLDYLEFDRLPTLTSLSGLSPSLTTVGNLSIFETGLTSLAGLENLTVVNEYLDISYNPNLQSLDGLNGLTSVGYLYINESYNLTDVRGLSNLSQADEVDFTDSASSIVEKMDANSPFCQGLISGSIASLVGTEITYLCNM